MYKYIHIYIYIIYYVLNVMCICYIIYNYLSLSLLEYLHLHVRWSGYKRPKNDGANVTKERKQKSAITKKLCYNSANNTIE